MPDESPPQLPGAPVMLVAADGVRLHGWHISPPIGADQHLGILIAHGFTGSMARPDVQQVARILSDYAGVLLLDLRGHGRSQGLSTLGDREVLDIDAGIAALRRLGYRTVASVGWSMGASAVLRHAGLVGSTVEPLTSAPDLAVAVSGTSVWGVRDTVAMRRVTWLVASRLGRQIARGMGVRIDATGWERPQDQWPLAPVDAASRLAMPLLVVHGDDDHYFGMNHPRALVAAATEGGVPVELWELAGFGHAEAAAARNPELLHRLGAYVVAAAGAIQASAAVTPESE